MKIKMMNAFYRKLKMQFKAFIANFYTYHKWLTKQYLNNEFWEVNH